MINDSSLENSGADVEGLISHSCSFHAPMKMSNWTTAPSSLSPDDHESLQPRAAEPSSADVGAALTVRVSAVLSALQGRLTHQPRWDSAPLEEERGHFWAAPLIEPPLNTNRLPSRFYNPVSTKQFSLGLCSHGSSSSSTSSRTEISVTYLLLLQLAYNNPRFYLTATSAACNQITCVSVIAVYQGKGKWSSIPGVWSVTLMLKFSSHTGACGTRCFLGRAKEEARKGGRRSVSSKHRRRLEENEEEEVEEEALLWNDITLKS